MQNRQRLYCCTNTPVTRYLPFCPNCATFPPLFSTQKAHQDTFPSSCISQSIRGPSERHNDSLFGDWGVTDGQVLIVSAPCRLGWTESLLIHIGLILRLDTGDKGATHVLILFAQGLIDLSRPREPAEERHYYLCSGAQWHISKRQCGGGVD